jgi:hypothetical protein
VLIITDLATIRRLHERLATPSTNFTSLSLLLKQVTEMRLILKLPLQLYKSLETSELNLDISRDITAWLLLDSILGALPKLAKVEIWMEHDDPCSWTVVNERIALAPIAKLSASSNLKIALSLPKLHPGLEQDDRHFTSETPKPPYLLYRRTRQRYHAKLHWKGSFEVFHKPDFPFLPDVPGFEQWPMAEVEEQERRLWKSGEDVEKTAYDMIWARFHENRSI